MTTSNVLVTSGNGFIAVHILSLLLQHGHTVTTTVRSESKTAHLQKIFSQATNAGRLKFSIVEDITTPGAFDDVVKSNTFDAILHTSSPLVFESQDVEKDVLLPAIQGTTSILKTARDHSPATKRIIITSSFAAVADQSKGVPGYAYSEKDWSQLTYEQAVKNPRIAYFASKTLAEKAAWEFVEREKPVFDLVTICPTMVYGPALQEVTSMKNLNASSAQFYTVFSGQEKELKHFGVWLWVDVRDVAKAHIAALEKSEAGGKRFLLSQSTFNIGQVADYIWTHYPERAQTRGIPKSTLSAGYPSEGTYTADTSASKNILGIEYIQFEDMLRDQLAQFVALEKELEVKVAA
ncbi:NADPH-dependent methylglyoxal reductase GRE2 protein [Ceratobasidium theobromae]|uniref:NADPH-dependent methylglyoxal reductase GRE2 protein n=1 Tax=Ceratobasidium theobromae TaxID=1582974 RepID=A0A5N5QP64_9AGAM|nr:NADPH-dependent methylglyoxal reductase GRE2 protein [Ceratobasidium theobromae]